MSWIIKLADACTGQSILPDLYNGLRDPSGNCEVKFDELADFVKLITNVIQILLVIAAFAAVVYIIYGGVQYIMSAGEPARLKKAKDSIANAVLGLIVVLVSFGVVNFLTGRF